MRVLIVHSDPEAVAALGRLVVGAGYDVATARSAEQAWVDIERGEAQLVLCATQLNDAHGAALCERIRRADRVGHVYFVLLIEEPSAAAMVRGLEAGVDDFLRQPCEPIELTAKLHTASLVLALETRDVAIFAMAKLAESRDHETGTHLERVRVYCRIITEQLATVDKFRDYITPEYIRLMYLCSPLHDIGKIAIPDCVLLKAGNLTDREHQIMKSHTTLGADTPDAAVKAHAGADFLKIAREIARCHHERWDGSGYPDGLAGEAIPLSARIMAVADVYDALVSKRVYKEAFAHDVARDMIEQGAGSDFDPDVVDAFLERESEFYDVRRRFFDDRKKVA